MNSNIFFLPFIGRYYANGGLFGKRIMILGESHYCDGGCCDCGNCRLCRQCAKFTQDVLRDFLDERKELQNWMRTFVKFERSLVGEKTDWALRWKIWDSVMFYNYLQVAMTGSRKAGTSAQYKQAANASLMSLMRTSLNVLSFGVSDCGTICQTNDGRMVTTS